MSGDEGGETADGERLEVEIDDVGFGPQIVALTRGARRVEFLPGPMFELTLRNVGTGVLQRVSTGESLTPDSAVVVLLPFEPIANPADAEDRIDGPFVYGVRPRTPLGDQGFVGQTQGVLVIRWILRAGPLAGPTFLNLGFLGGGTITVTARLRIVGDTLSLDVEVDMASTIWSLFDVAFPVFRVKPSPDPERDVVVLTTAHGGVVRNPGANLDPNYPNAVLREFIHPGLGCTMQFTAHYVADGPQLFVQTKDPDGYVKRFLWSAETNPYAPDAGWPDRWAKFALAVYPKNNARPSGVPGEPAYRNPFPIEISLIDGDWYDAARRYRRWALAQPWAARGPFSSDPTYSSRQRLLDLAILRDELKTSTANGLLREFGAMRAFFGAEYVSVLWYGWYTNSFFRLWPDYVFNPVAAQIVKALREADYRVLGYSLVMAWDADAQFGAQFDAFRYAVKNPDGSAQAVGGIGVSSDPTAQYFGFFEMQYAHERARAIAVEQWRHMARTLELDGQYLDDYSSQNNRVDFDPSAPVAGGTDVYGRGKRAFGYALRSAQKQIDATGVARRDFTFWGEFPNEFASDVTEAVVVYPFFRGFDALREVPLQGVVYHERQFAAEIYDPALSEFLDGDVTPSRVAQAFHMGRGYAVFSASLAEPFLPERPQESPNFPVWEAIRRFIATNRALRRFRLWGEFLRPLPGSFATTWDKGGPDEAEVQSSVWRFGDEVAAILSNTGAAPATFGVELSRARYPIVADAAVYEIAPDGAYVDPRPFDDGAPFTVELPPGNVRAFVATKAAAPVPPPRIYVLERPPGSDPLEGAGMQPTRWYDFERALESVSVGINWIGGDPASLLRAVVQRQTTAGNFETVLPGQTFKPNGFGVTAFEIGGVVLPPGRYRLLFDFEQDMPFLQTAVAAATLNGVAL